MSELKYSKDHEWLRLNGDGTAVVGITDYAQDQLGDVVYVELPEPGTQLSKDVDAAVVESVKAASDVKSPVSGTVTEINELLSDEPEKVNTVPTEDGWFYIVELSNPDEIEQLMDEEAYLAYVNDL
jgi:glycine cleavage system H protein